jgi:rhomboid family GlyGly-CTERM serine protease
MNIFLNRARFSAWLPWCLLFALSTTFQISGVYPALRLDLAATDSHWLYTALTCHLVHITTRHWLYNSLALLIIAFIFHQQFNWQRCLLTYALSAVSISLGLLWFPHGLHSYAGLSGILHGYFAMGCLLLYSQQARLALGLGLLLLVKLIAEPFIGSVFIAHPEFAIANSAHAYGVIGGLLSWLVDSALRFLRACGAE